MMMMMMTGADTLETIDLQTATMYWRSDGILKIVVKAKAHITLEDSKEIFNHTKRFSSGGKDLLVMTIAGEDSNIDPEVRDFSMSAESSVHTKGEAIILHSLAHKLLINFALKFYKPNRPMKMFTKEEEAIEWLLSL
jgi:hypothetical protein